MSSSLPHLTIAYITNRLEPRVEWFLASLRRELAGAEARVVVVDRLKEERRICLPDELIHVTPKPSVWQGPGRLTTRDYFAASNARNTALCLAPDGWIAYVDDLSVLMPGWFGAVKEGMSGGYVALGAYKKVLGLSVNEEGVTSYREFPAGVDSRWGSGADHPVVAGGSWLYGCSVAAPVEGFLSINGWDEDCDSLGGEDYVAGMMLERAGYSFRYDRRMLTLESEEGHHDGSALPRFDKGTSPHDKSHTMLQMVMRGERRVAPNYFGPGGIRALREQVLKGEPFPLSANPRHDWYDGQPLSEL